MRRRGLLPIITLSLLISSITVISLTVSPLSKYTMGEVLLDAEGKLGGYNDVNTTIYAILLCLTALLVYYVLKYFEVEIKEEHLYSIIPLLISGSLLRVCEDTNLVSYHVPLITPFIYILLGGYLILGIMAVYSGKRWIQAFLIASFSFLISFFFGNFLYTFPPLITILILLSLKKRSFYKELSLILSSPMISGASFLICFAISHPLPPYSSKVLSIGAVAIMTGVVIVWIGKMIFRIKGFLPFLPAIGQSIDGISAFVGVTELGYVEKHVFSRFLLSIHPEVYLLTKILLGAFFGLLLYWIGNKNKEVKNLAYIVLFFITFLGLSPGLRSFIRIVLGTRTFFQFLHFSSK